MSKRSHDSNTSSSIASALSGSGSKKSRYSDAGEMTGNDAWGVNRDKDPEGTDKYSKVMVKEKVRQRT